MKYTIHPIDRIKALILDPSGTTVAIALHLEGRIWNIFTPDYGEHLGRTEEGKGDVVRKFGELVGAKTFG